MTATRIQNSGGTTTQWTYQDYNLINGGTISMYVKRTGSTNQTFRFFGNNGAEVSADFTATDQWQRFEFYILPSNSVKPQGITNASTGLATDILLWGAQLNIGATAKPYFPTTDRLNVPRLTYQNGGGGCPSLLLEKQSTNLALYSEQFDDAYWIKQNLTVTANSIVSPDGTQNADLLTLNTLNAEHNVYAPAAGLTITPNAPYTFSCYVKKGTGRYFCTATYFTGVGFGPYATFDLNTATLVASGASFGTYVSSKIENMGNDWYRCSVTGYGNYSSLIFAPDIRTASSLIPGVAFTGAGETMYLWGAQVEASSYATSLINTTSASATRVADIAGSAVNSALFNSPSGVLFIEGNVESNSTPAGGICVAGTGSNNRVQIYNDGANMYALIEVNNSFVFTANTSGIDITQSHKYAVSWALNDFTFYVDGVQIATDTSGATFSSGTLNQFRFSDQSTNYFYGKIKQAVVFNNRLTNAELASLTTI
jgi:hypothetical protein